MNKVNHSTEDIIENKKDILKQQFSEIFEDGSLNIDKLKEIFENTNSINDEKFYLNWAGKKNVSKVISESSRASLKADKENSVDFEKTENLLIEGDNLEVLKLLQKSYFNSVKMIYIDPPYNTGNGFIYNDNYRDNLKKYLADSGQINDDGTRNELIEERAGRNHSNWLNFMYPRLYLARNLLKEDGVIFISIGDDEVHHLKMICNEIFGEENFISQMVRKTGVAARLDAKYISDETDYILVYAKAADFLKINKKKAENLESYIYSDEFENKRGKYKLNKLDRGSINYSDAMDYPIKSPEGTLIFPGGTSEKNNWCWRWSKEKVEWGIKSGFIEFKKKNSFWTIYFKQYQYVDNEDNPIERENPYKNLLIKGFNNEVATSELSKLFEFKYFDYPKPVSLIRNLLEIASNENDIILDFFAGSGTTAQAVMELNKEDKGNRRFILVQYPEKIEEKSVAKKHGYDNIFEITRERIKRANEKYDLKQGFKIFKLIPSNYKIWNEDIKGETKEEKTKNLLKQIKKFDSSLVKNYNDLDVLYEIILKEGFDLNSTVEELKIKNITFYLIKNMLKDETMYLSLNKKINNDTVEEIISNYEGNNFVFLDESLSDSDKQNLDKKVNLKII